MILPGPDVEVIRRDFELLLQVRGFRVVRLGRVDVEFTP